VIKSNKTGEGRQLCVSDEDEEVIEGRVGEKVNGLHGVSRRMKYALIHEKTNTKHVSEGNFFGMGFRSKEPTEKDDRV